MRARVDAATDVAMIGAWDASRNESPVSRRFGKDWERTLEDDLDRGHLFLIRTGGDCGGPIDVYLDTEIPGAELAHGRAIEGEFLISIPSGRLIVGGVEDYRNQKPQITSDKSVVSVPAGEYALRCFVGLEGEAVQGASASALENALGRDDYRYYRKVQQSGCLGFLTPLLFPIIAFRYGWKIALAGTAVILLGYFHVREQILKRIARYKRIEETVDEVLRRARETEPPLFILKLRPVEQGTNLKGGSVYCGS